MGDRFPADFWWGTATAAYQIEGAVAEDGRGPSVWDTFSHTPGKTEDGATGDVACDHYHRYRDDVALMADLGVTHYRFSISWPRVQPDGAGAVNQPGLDFYSRLVDELLAHNITPVPTLFHWDLPQALEDGGGWLARDTAERFAEYASLAAQALGDRVPAWITLNEPFVHVVLGYAIGTHAPGRTLLSGSFPALHHHLLGHGLAVQALRAALPASAQVAITNNVATARAISDAPDDHAAAAAMELLHVETFNDPLFLGRYPEGLDTVLVGLDWSVVRDGDLATIAQPLDFLGINYYAPSYVRAGKPGDVPFRTAEPEGFELTEMGWPVIPEGFTEILVAMKKRYGDALPPVVITENGAAYPDAVGPEGRVDDPARISYIDRHLTAVRAAMDAGVDVRGYFVWSFLDNFEWAFGYRPRFGIVHIDYETQQRTVKQSGWWYRDLIAAQRSRSS